MRGSNAVIALEVGEIGHDEVLRYLGYRGQELSDDLMARIGELSRLCRQTARPRACLRTFEVEGAAMAMPGKKDGGLRTTGEGADGQRATTSGGGVAERVTPGTNTPGVGASEPSALDIARPAPASDHDIPGDGASVSEPGAPGVGASASDHGTPEIRLRGCALRLVGHDIVSHLEGARAVGLMAVTLGIGFEQELRRQTLLDPPAGLLLDAIGTVAVEQAADAVEAQLVADAHRRGLFATWRYSPGYGDFPLEAQPTLLAALDAQRRLGISLSDSLLMIPTKSVTAVVGMLASPRPGDRPGCGSCTLRDHCTVRTTGRTCHD